MTDQQFVDLWLRRYKASTRETYKSAAYRFLFFLEETKLGQVTVDLLLDFEESLSYLGAATKIRIFRTLYLFLRPPLPCSSVPLCFLFPVSILQDDPGYLCRSLYLRCVSNTR